MLRIAIPKGSLEAGAFELFKLSNLPIKRKGGRGYNLYIEDPRISEALLLRPQEIPRYIEDNEFDLGITGYDWIVETESSVKEVADLQYSKQGWSKVRIILATDNNNPVEKLEDILPSSKVVTEYPRITRRFFKRIGKGKVKIRGSYGVTEVKVPRLAQYLVDVAETGETLQANNMKILTVILESSTKLIANKESWANPEKKRAIKEIASLLLGVLRARDKVLIKMNISKLKVDKLMTYIPSLRPPTISPFYSRNYNSLKEERLMVETVVEKSKLNIIIPKIKEIGARDILELDISKMIP